MHNITFKNAPCGRSGAPFSAWHQPYFAKVSFAFSSSLLPRGTGIHVHVSHPDGEAKFWLTPEVHLATATGLNQRQLSEAQSVIENHLGEIKHAWHSHFGA